MEPETKKFKKKWGPAEGKKLSRRLKEPMPPPPGCMWLKAVSKNPDERQDGREGLSLLFLLFEDTLELKADQDSDPLEDLDDLMHDGTQPALLIDQFALPRWSKNGKPILYSFRSVFEET